MPILERKIAHKMTTLCSHMTYPDPIVSDLRQHRTKTIYWILCMSCLHLFRHIAQFVLARRQPCRVLVVQSDEKSDCAIHAQSLCGIALKKYLIYFSPCYIIYLYILRIRRLIPAPIRPLLNRRSKNQCQTNWTD